MSSQYKDTLNLPSTKFPMKANLAQREPERLASWQQQDIYGKLRKDRSGRQQYILHDGPPYANGKIHLGHAVNKVLKDIVIKSQTLNGFDCPYVPGWDCHGLPIELNVEKKVGKPGVKVTSAEFRHACRDYATGQVDIQREAFQRLGILGEWDNPYLTMNYGYEANVIRSLASILENGHLQQGHKPVHWCLDCSSSLAEAEVEYYDKKSLSIDVAFALTDPAELYLRLGIENPNPSAVTAIPIWTTTPWTLPANQAIALHPDLDYVLVAVTAPSGKYHLVIAQELMDSVLERYHVSAHHVLAAIKGHKLEKLSCQHPFLDRISIVVLAEHVTVDAGTGAVHTAPAHGREDYLVWQAYGLAMENPVLGNGCYRDDLPIFGGQHIFKANDQIVELLKEKHVLLSHCKIEHSYPHCWRHKTALIFRATPQWFINLDQNGLREKAFAEIKKTTWLPEAGEARINKMIENHPGWCISRQRAWGVPMSLLVHKQTGELHPNMVELLEKVAVLVEEGGVDVAFDITPEALLGDAGKDYDKIPDTLDVWFDSGVTHRCVLQARDYLTVPANLYLEGSDQHRGWFQSSLLTSIAMRDTAPYKTVLTHGFTVDKNGRKMSKSLGNIIEPQKVINALGADVLRLYIASTDFRHEMTVSDEIFTRTSDTYRRLRNTARFMLANLHDFEPAEHEVGYDDLLPLDQYALDCALQVQQDIIDAYNNFQFQVVTQKLHHFCAALMGGFYLDIIKDRQYTMQADAPARRSAQTALYHMLQAVVRWFAPILSFTADEISSCLPAEHESVFLQEWYQDLTPLSSSALLSRLEWENLLAIRTEVNKAVEEARNQGVIGSALAAEVTLYASAAQQAMLSKLGEELHFVFITSSATVADLNGAPADAITTSLDSLKIKLTASEHAKCERCWHHDHSVGQNPAHTTLCQRCISNVDGQGEVRQYA